MGDRVASKSILKLQLRVHTRVLPIFLFPQ